MYTQSDDEGTGCMITVVISREACSDCNGGHVCASCDARSSYSKESLEGVVGEAV